jgi:ribosomal protein S18 acetylase RimI-like enzyme
MTPSVDHAISDEQIAATFAVMHQLRPQLEINGYVERIRGLIQTDGVKLLALSDGGVVRAVALYRFMDMIYCGRLLYVDDLVADESVRSKGYGTQLVDRLKAEATAHGCSEIQLISRVTRERAHRFYFRQGFGIECFHFRAKLGEQPG